MADEATAAPPSVRETLEQAYSSLDKQEPRERPTERRPADAPSARAVDKEAPEATPAADAAREPDSAARPRDEQGRFLPKTFDAVEQHDTAPASAPTTDDQAQAEAPEPEPEPAKAAPPAPASEPPETWSPAAKAEWSRIPPAVQEEIRRRESDVSQGFRQRAEQVSALEPLAQAIAPYQQKLALRGVHPASAVQQLLAVQDLLDRDPIGGVAHVARAYGVDLRQFSAALEHTQQPRNPEVEAVRSEVAQINQFLQQQAQAVQQNEFSRINSEVETFRADAAAHPYFDQVRPAMAQLMQQGLAATLQDAYDHCCWAIPEIRNRILEDQKRQEATARQRGEREAADKARRAGVSVNGAPPRGNGAMPGNSGKSIRALLEASYDRAASQ